MCKLLIVVILQTQSDLTILIQIMSATFSERSPVCSKGRGVIALTDRQIRMQLSGVRNGSITFVSLMFSIFSSQYRNVTQTTRHIQAVIKNFSTLKLTRTDFSEQYEELTSNSENFNSIFLVISSPKWCQGRIGLFMWYHSRSHQRFVHDTNCVSFDTLMWSF